MLIVLYCIISLLTNAFWMMKSPAISGGKRHIDDTMRSQFQKSVLNLWARSMGTSCKLYCWNFSVSSSPEMIHSHYLLTKLSMYLILSMLPNKPVKQKLGLGFSLSTRMLLQFLWMNDFEIFMRIEFETFFFSTFIRTLLNPTESYLCIG